MRRIVIVFEALLVILIATGECRSAGKKWNQIQNFNGGYSSDLNDFSGWGDNVDSEEEEGEEDDTDDESFYDSGTSHDSQTEQDDTSYYFESDFDDDEDYRDYLGNKALMKAKFDPMRGFGGDPKGGEDDRHFKEARLKDVEGTNYGRGPFDRQSLLDANVYVDDSLREKYNSLSRKMHELQEKMEEMKNMLEFQNYRKKLTN